jgi:lipopolysaccharide/colanic/teichoic acid biosynthesis glycosyltransferase
MTLQFTNLPTDMKIETNAASPAVVEGAYRSYGKRALDLLLILATCWFTVPVVFAIALVVLATGQSPFYGQKRIGLDGQVFRMWKLRTMLPRAEERLEEYLAANPAAREEWDAKQKLKNDPRVTPIGRWLRKSSMDELPQLFNVFNGTMSLVGPRPMMLDQREQYDGEAYFKMRPGLTGLWQVSDRHNGDFVGRVAFDEEYHAKMSFAQDTTILAKTVLVVVRGTGC